MHLAAVDRTTRLRVAMSLFRVRWEGIRQHHVQLLNKLAVAVTCYRQRSREVFRIQVVRPRPEVLRFAVQSTLGPVDDDEHGASPIDVDNLGLDHLMFAGQVVDRYPLSLAIRVCQHVTSPIR